MARWRVYGTVIGSKYLGIHEADTKEEAEQKAIEENGYISLCHQCAGDCEDAEIHEATAEQAGDDEEDD